jgi:spermidine/putrescine transport system ATP-binding protein
MRSIRIENVTKKYNGELIFERLNLTIPGGKFFALLGPSGCGKTTLLRLIGGFERVDSGRIYLGDEEITDKPINQRRVNTVFQNYALFPHLNVYENVAYSQVIKGVSSAVIKEKVHKILTAVNLHNHMYKSIKQLSGGQQQRVALARAIINDPEVLLLDEPLAALDVKLREKMLIELIDLQDKLQTTFVYVTHDQLEALTVADQMAILNCDGEIEQLGTPKEIYEFPASLFVAKFVGTTNSIKGILRSVGHAPYIDVENLGSFSIDISRPKAWMVEGGTVIMGIRPEKILISKQPREGFSNMVRGAVESIVYHGRSTQYNIRLKNGERIQVFEQNDEHFPQEVIDYDNEVYLYWQKENVVLLER